jgi:hypothetical protein
MKVLKEYPVPISAGYEKKPSITWTSLICSNLSMPDQYFVRTKSAAVLGSWALPDVGPKYSQKPFWSVMNTWGNFNYINYKQTAVTQLRGWEGGLA